jgi:hypothetical protein
VAPDDYLTGVAAGQSYRGLALSLADAFQNHQDFPHGWLSIECRRTSRLRSDGEIARVARRGVGQAREKPVLMQGSCLWGMKARAHGVQLALGGIAFPTVL